MKHYASTLRYQRNMIAADRQNKRNKRKNTRNELLLKRFLDEQGIAIQPVGIGISVLDTDR
jgi:hypothetical protein